MTGREEHVQQGRRFVVHLPSGVELHGIEWPSGRVICDDPIQKWMVSTTMAELLEPTDVTRVEYVPDAAEVRAAAFAEAADALELAAEEPCSNVESESDRNKRRFHLLRGSALLRRLATETATPTSQKD